MSHDHLPRGGVAEPEGPSTPAPSAPSGPDEDSRPRPNQRLMQRVPVRLAVSDPRDSAPLGETRDLTLAGLFLATRARLRVGDVLGLTLTLPGDTKDLSVEAEVVRVEDEGAGLRFTQVADADQRRLRRVLVSLNDAVGSRATAEHLHAASGALRTEVHGAAEVRGLLATMRDTGVPLRLLPPSRPAVGGASFRALHADHVELELVEPFPLGVGEEVYALCTLRYVSYSFLTRVTAVEEKVVRLALPERVVHAERRSARRERADDTWLVLPLPWSPGETARWQVIDRSDGGLGLRAAPGSWTHLPGARLDGARLAGPEGEQPLTGAVVRNVTRVAGTGGEEWLRIGVSHGETRAPVTVIDAKVADGRGPLARLRGAMKLGWTWLELQWRQRERARGPARREVTEPEVVRLSSRSGRPLVGLLQQSFPEHTGAGTPLVVIAPGFGGRKEQMSYLASVIVETFRARHADVAVLRFDGTNNLGESGKDPGCEAEGRHTLHYTVGGVIDDLRGVIDWTRRNDRLDVTKVVVVSVSFSSTGVMRWLAEDNPPEVGLWVSYMGAADAQDGVRNVSGHYDVFSAASTGRPLGNVTLIGCLVDAQVFWDDLVRLGTGTLPDARRDMAKIAADVWWVSGRHDAFMDVERVKDVLSVASTARRELLRVDSGHVPRTGDEAIRQFKLVAGEIWRHLHGTRIEAQAPSLAALEARRRWEWERTRRSRLDDPVSFWREYLLGEGGSYDVMTWLPAYRELVGEQVSRLRPEGLRVLDVGAGTGNVAAAAAAAGAAEVVCVDLVAEALTVARAKLGDGPAETHVTNLDGTARTALLAWRAGRLRRFQDLARRLDGLPIDAARRLDAAADPALLAAARGARVQLDLLPSAQSLGEADAQLVEDLGRLCRAAADPREPADGLQRLDRRLLDAGGGLPLPDASVDVAVASLLLSYLHHPEDLLVELHRVVRPGGRLVLSSMRRDADTSRLFLSLVELLESLPPEHFESEAERRARLDAARGFHSRGAELFRLEEEGTFRFYDEGELVTMLLAAGFEDPRVSYSFGAPAQAVVVTCSRP